MSSKNPVSADDVVPASWFDETPGHSVEEWGAREYESGTRRGFDAGIGAAVSAIREVAAHCWMNDKAQLADALKSLANDIGARTHDNPTGKKN